MLAHGDLVTVSRDGVEVTTLACAVDPALLKIYGPFDADVEAGDILQFRGLTRRVTETPERWRNPFTGWEAGSVITIEAGPVWLPDYGHLFRPSGALGVLNPETGLRAPVTPGGPFWSGPCLVKPKEADGSTPEAGDQTVGVVPFVVTVPLALIDVRAGDVLTVTQSRDGRLETRDLVITSVRASSTALERELLAFDNQGRASVAVPE